MEFAKLNCPAGNYPRYSPTLLTEISARRIAEMRPDICNGLAGSAPFLFNVECPPFKQVRSRRILRDSSANTPCSFGEYSPARSCTDRQEGGVALRSLGRLRVQGRG